MLSFIYTDKFQKNVVLLYLTLVMGHLDGGLLTAKFYNPTYLAFDKIGGTIYVSDHYQFMDSSGDINVMAGIRLISLTVRNVTTLVGRAGTVGQHNTPYIHRVSKSLILSK